MTRLAVVGHPVAHSLSPTLFSEIMNITGRSLSYERLDVAPAALDERFAEAVRTRSFHGWNVTIPHKERLAALVDRVAPAAAAVGAINVVRFEDDGTTTGANTDVAGVDLVLARNGIAVRGGSVAIAGTGGAARAVAAAVAAHRPERVTFLSRDADRARTRAAAFATLFPNVRFDGAQRLTHATEYGLFVNATPLGMHGFAAGSVLPEHAPAGAWAFDCVYRPERTAFLTEAAERGMHVANGVDMLVGQALAAYRIWFGETVCAPTDPAYERLAAAVRKAL